MPEVTNSTTEWIDLYAASGIAPGTKILIQNKSNGYALVLEASSLPDTNNRTGRMLFMPDEIQVDAGSPGVYYRCFEGIKAFVQVKS